jgi:hypothetical protein
MRRPDLVIVAGQRVQVTSWLVGGVRALACIARAARPRRAGCGSAHVPPDTTACIFWLKNRDPQHWRDVQQMERVRISGSS